MYSIIKGKKKLSPLQSPFRLIPIIVLAATAILTASTLYIRSNVSVDKSHAGLCCNAVTCTNNIIMPTSSTVTDASCDAWASRVCASSGGRKSGGGACTIVANNPQCTGRNPTGDCGTCGGNNQGQCGVGLSDTCNCNTNNNPCDDGRQPNSTGGCGVSSTPGYNTPTPTLIPGKEGVGAYYGCCTDDSQCVSWYKTRDTSCDANPGGICATGKRCTNQVGGVSTAGHVDCCRSNLDCESWYGTTYECRLGNTGSCKSTGSNTCKLKTAAQPMMTKAPTPKLTPTPTSKAKTTKPPVGKIIVPTVSMY